MMDKLINFIETRIATREERGASAVEYGLLIAGIAALIVVAVFALGPVVKEAFTDTCDEMTGTPTTISATATADGRPVAAPNSPRCPNHPDGGGCSRARSAIVGASESPRGLVPNDYSDRAELPIRERCRVHEDSRKKFLLAPGGRQPTQGDNTMFAKIDAFIQNRLAKREERGASAVEYGLLIAGIAALIVVAVFALGPVVKEAFTDTCTSIKAGAPDVRQPARR